MTKLEVSLIAFSAFCFGFMASEYRSHVVRENAKQHHAEYENTTAHVQRSNTLPAFVNQEDVQPAAHNDGDVFSWMYVNELIRTRQFDRALVLLKQRQDNADDPASVWLAMAHIYQQTNRSRLLVEAWLRYLDEELDAEKSGSVVVALKSHLLRVFENPLMISGDNDWLIEQLTGLLDFQMNDGELHWMLASLYLQQEDNYQAQYHALMAANDPAAQKRAENILAQLSGADISGPHVLPLVRLGNQYVVNVDIEGRAARLLLDTGASLSGVSQTFIERFPELVKERKNIQLNTASGIESSFLFTVDRLTMGDLHFSSHILARLPMTNVQHFDGLLGVDILGRFDFVIDQDAALLKLTPRM